MCGDDQFRTTALYSYLFVILYSHAQSINEDSNHDPSVEVFAFHDPPQFLPEVYPGLNNSVLVLHNTTRPSPTSPASQISPLYEAWIRV